MKSDNKKLVQHVLNSMRNNQDDSAKTILDNIRHIAPIVVYEDSPLSYVETGMGVAFHKGENECIGNNGHTNDDSLSINYFIIRVGQNRDHVD
jgi:hypothetical protein